MIPVIKVRKILEAAAASVSEQELRQAALDVISTYEAPGRWAGLAVALPLRLLTFMLPSRAFTSSAAITCIVFLV